jgi:hypothetical protein
MIADHHAAAARCRLFLTLKTGGCAIPPIARHDVFRFLLSLSGISRRDSNATVFARDSQNSTILHHCKVTDSGVRDLSFGSGWVCPGELWLAAAECGLFCTA